MTDPIPLKNRDRIRIRTTANLRPELRPKGRDTIVEIVHADGTVTPIPDLISAFWHVDTRSHYAVAHFVANGVVVDVEGTEPDLLAAKQLEIDSLVRKNAELEKHCLELEAKLGGITVHPDGTTTPPGALTRAP